MSKPAPKMKFTILWNPIELPVKEAPNVGMASVQRLDEDVMVLQTNTQANLTISLYMMGILLGLCMLTALFFFNKIEGKIAFFQIFFDVSEGSFNSGSNEFLFVGGFLLLLYLFLCGVAFWLLDISLFQPRPSPVVLNRRTKKAYGSHRGKLVELDWKNITPIITEAVNVSSGVQRMCQLVFAELDPPKNPERRTRRGKGFVVYFHPAWGWAECRAFWELIRTYMEESPKKLPSVLITPPVRTVDNLLAEGPYADMNPQAENWAYIQEYGHAKMGWQAVAFFFCAPFLLFNALQLFARRQVKLPETALPPAKPGNESSLYKLIKLDEQDSALWLKASRRVGVQLLVLMVLGMTMYSYLGYSFVHSHNESTKAAQIKHAEELKAAEARRKEQEAEEQERKRLWEEKINSKEYKEEQEERRKAQYIRNCIIYSYSGKGRAFCEQAYEREKKAKALEEAQKVDGQ